MAAAASPRRRWTRRLLIALGIIVALRLAAPALITRQINQQLAAQLLPKASLGGVSFSLLSGRFEARQLRVDQPDGFTGEPLLTCSGVTLRVAPLSLLRRTLTVHELAIRDLHLRVVRQGTAEKADLNVLRVLKPQPPTAPEPASEAPSRAVHLARLRVERLSTRWEDLTGQTPWVAGATNLDVAVDGLLFDPGAPPENAGAGLASLQATWVQPGRPDAVLAASARIGTLSTAIPSVNAVARLTGFSLLSLGPYFKPGLGVALGGESLDLKADLTLRPESIQALALIQMESSQVWPIRVTGDPRNPTVDKGALAGALASRPVKAAENLLSNTDDAVTAAAGGVSRTVGRTLDGAFRSVGALGNGLVQSATRLASGDVKGAGTAAGGAVTNTVATAAGTVGGAAGGLLDSVQAAGEAAIGQPDAERWWKEIPTRAESARTDMKKALDALPPLGAPTAPAR